MPGRVAEDVVRRRPFGRPVRLRVDLHGVSVLGPGDEMFIDTMDKFAELHASEDPAEGDGEPAPQLGCPPLPDQMAQVVVAVRTQRLPHHTGVMIMDAHAPQRPSMRTQLPAVAAAGDEDGVVVNVHVANAAVGVGRVAVPELDAGVVAPAGTAFAT